MLLAGVVDVGRRAGWSCGAAPAGSAGRGGEVREYACPILGCTKVFAGGLGRARRICAETPRLGGGR